MKTGAEILRNWKWEEGGFLVMSNYTALERMIDIELQTERDASVKNLWQRNYYKDTLTEVDNQLQALKTEREDKEKRLQADRDQGKLNDKVQAVHSTNIYLFYSNLFKFAPDWLQFIFHTVLSVFIAIASPLGIRILMIQAEPEAVKRVSRETNWSPLVERWVSLNWAYGTIMTNEYFNQQAGKVFGTARYNRILAAARRSGAVKNREIMKPEFEAIADILEAIE